jgi:hypothetical protein
MYFDLAESTEDMTWKARAYTVGLDVLASFGSRVFLREHFGERLERVRQILAGAQPSAEVGRALAHLVEMTQTREEQEVFFRRAVEEFSEEIWSLVGLARLEVASETTEQHAEEMLWKALWLAERQRLSQPWMARDVRDASYLRGRIYARRGELAQAAQDLNRALKISPGWRPAQSELNTVQRKLAQR